MEKRMLTKVEITEIIAKALKESEYDTCMFGGSVCIKLAKEIIAALADKGYYIVEIFPE
jgi:hypothetical protein